MLGDGDKGTVMGETMKRGYVLSHYAKYATGRKRIAIGKVSTNSSVNGTAYSGQDDFTIILVNNGSSPVPSLKVNLPIIVKTSSAVITSGTQNMAIQNTTLAADKKSVLISLPEKSIVSIKLTK